jgi:hypothetical protein
VSDEPVVITDMPSTEPKEPAVSSGLTVGFATLLVNGLVVVGAPLNFEQKTYLVGALTFLAPIIAGFVIRSKVFSPKTVEQIQAYWQLVVADKDRAIAAVKTEMAAQNVVGPIIDQTLPRLFASLPVATVPPSPAAQPTPEMRQEMPQGLVPADTRMMPAVPLPSEAYQRFMAEQPPQRHQGYQSPPDPPAGNVNTAQPEGYYDYAPRREPEGYRRHRRDDSPE